MRAKDEFLLFLQHWTKINKPGGLVSLLLTVEWPEKRYCHATTCVSGPLPVLIVVGGYRKKRGTINDFWICDLTTKQWKKVRIITLF